MMIAHRKYISMIFCTVIYIVLLLPNGIELYDSSLVSKNLIDGDIFSQTYTFSYKFIFFVFVWPQIISPFVTFFFIFEIIRKVRNRCGQSITLSSTDKMTKNVTISLIICSIPPIVASLLTFLLHFLFFFKIAHVSRSLWNISEILLSFIGGSNPIFLVCFMKPFRLAILDFVNPNMVHHLQTKKTCNKINGFTTIKKIVVVDKNECEKLEG
ncbi:GPCR, rhodopsin-like, 7TM domain-containing protein [Strongyloides ratti]|uniref:GPCR, rhodopsin-like, 7TM domain-containing protein n=1 Tax=Strongyloides ratti TaxID=34506 RepID=A0A090LRL1_STRRB|nr:GPCR, rhodopsin-like, 7TM domain-containing protein [Strongyloides ratti]CEF70191.1 GPCR, rhodopsin-like, 7TM domain-containing protein [Strongyloides ratti]